MNLSAVLKYNPYHDELGRFTTADNAAFIAPRTTPGTDFVSPNKGEDLSFESAAGRLRSQEQSLLLSYSGKINAALGIQGTTSSVVGAWSDGAENSTVGIYGEEVPYEAIRAAASLKGLLEKQKAVIAFKARKGGEARITSMDIPGDMTEAHAGLLKAGLEFHTLQPIEGGVRVWTFQERSAKTENAKLSAYADAAGVVPTTWTGDGEFIGSWDSRADGAKAYRRELAAYAKDKPGVKQKIEKVIESWRRRAGQ